MAVWKPSVTVAAIIEKDGRFLLVEEETTDGLKLNNPAGHLDPGETPAQGCVREIVTDLAYITVEPDGFVLRELAPGLTVERVREFTGAPLTLDRDLRVMQFD